MWPSNSNTLILFALLATVSLGCNTFTNLDDAEVEDRDMAADLGDPVDMASDLPVDISTDTPADLDAGGQVDMPVDANADADSGADLGDDMGSSVSPIDVLWTFESMSSDTSNTYSFSGLPTSEFSPPQGFMSLPVQAENVVQGQPMDILELGQIGVDDEFIVGGWIRPSSQGPTVDSTVISKFQFNNQFVGWSLGIDQGRWSCRIANGSVVTAALGTQYQPDDWVHVACYVGTFQGTAVVRIYVNGAMVDESNGEFANHTGAFRLGVNHSSMLDFVGNVDEIFVGSIKTTTPGAGAAIAKIHACGADGSLCPCDPANPADYESCGRLMGDCGRLPACE